MALQVVGGLLHLHSLGVIHRDLRASNVLVQSLDPVCVAISDLGLSHLLSAFADVHTADSAGVCASEVKSSVRNDAALGPVMVRCTSRFCPILPFGGAR
jgi:serine/threonine protein kinase